MFYLPFFDQVPYLYYAQVAFTIWMLIDCHQRRAETYWFWVILFLPFFGAWVYFFAVKVKGYRRFKGLNFWPFHSRPSLAELRYRAEQTPTQTNHMALAERLIEKGEFEEPIPHLEAVVQREPDYCQGLYYLAMCRMETGNLEEAISILEKLNEREPRWRDYRAWILLREARCRAGDAEGAVSTCEELVRYSSTLKHQCLLAKALMEAGRGEEAGQVIDKGLKDYAFTPRALRRRHRPWAGVARRLQKQNDKQCRNKRSD